MDPRTEGLVDPHFVGAEIERWNRILTEPKPIFNIAPNAFLVAMIQIVAAAQEQAKKLGLRITTQVAKAEDYDRGTATWDLMTSVSTRRESSAWRP